VALPLTAVSSQNVIGSFEARFFCAQTKTTAKVAKSAKKSRGESSPKILALLAVLDWAWLLVGFKRLWRKFGS
jgi:hypothetical protein